MVPITITVLFVVLTIGAAAIVEFGLPNFISQKFDDLTDRKVEHSKTVHNWNGFRRHLASIYQSDAERFKEYKSIFLGKLKYLVDGRPELMYIKTRKDILNERTVEVNSEIKSPFHRERGLWVLKENWLDSKGGNIKSLELFIQMLAEYDAKYCILTGTDKFYRNTFGENQISNMYNEAFLEELAKSMKGIVAEDVKNNSMNMKMLKSKLMRRVYQESYIQMKANDQIRESHRQDNLDALFAIQKGDSISPEQFQKAFGDEETVMVEMPNHRRTMNA